MARWCEACRASGRAETSVETISSRGKPKLVCPLHGVAHGARVAAETDRSKAVPISSKRQQIATRRSNAWRLHTLHRVSYADIARRLGVSPATAYQDVAAYAQEIASERKG